MHAIVNWPVCPIQSDPAGISAEPELSHLEDEVLYGMTVEVTGPAENGFLPIMTDYRYAGWAPEGALLPGEDTAAAWTKKEKKIVLHKHCADVLALPKVQGAFLARSLPMGARVAPLGKEEEGWQRVALPDGREGYICASALDTYWETPCAVESAALRRALTDTARLYGGTQYRWGGKSAEGIDCSGLCSMAYMLCGILIYRDAAIKEGFPIHEIPLSDMREGDLLYFPGHIAIYLGDWKYIHATGRVGDNGVTINSFDPKSPLFRADLPGMITAVGSFF